MMKKNKLNQKDWLEYLNILNNREMSKRNSSGFTTWALFGLIGFSLLRLIDSLPIIYMDIENLFLFKLFVTNIFNFFIVISTTIAILTMPLDVRRKIHNELMKKFTTSITGILYFIFFIGFFCNVYIISDLIFYRLSIAPYCIFAIFDIFFIIGLLIIKRITIKKDNKMPRIDSGYYFVTKHKNPHKHKAVLLCLVLLLTLLFSIYQIKQNYYILNYLSVLKSALYLIVLVGSIILYIGNCIGKMKSRWIEEFERKIMLQNLGEKEIVKEFIDKFVGKDITKWLKEIEDETTEITTRFIKIYDKFNKEIDSLNKEEKDSNKRIMKAETILKNITKRGKNVSKKDIEKYKNNTEKIDYFLKQGPLSDEEELIISEFSRNRKKESEVFFDVDNKIETGIKELEKYINDIKKLAELKDK